MEEEIILPEQISDDQSSEKIGKILITIFAIIGIFMLVLAAKIVLANSSTGSSVSESDYSGSKLTLKVSIPCPGHASLIIYEVKKLEGVSEVKFRFPNLFDVYYDPAKTSKEKILSLEIFKEYPASVTE